MVMPIAAALSLATPVAAEEFTTPANIQDKMYGDQVMTQEGPKSFKDIDPGILKKKDKTEFKVEKLPDGSEFKERVFKGEADKGIVLEREYKNEKNLENGGKSIVISEYREYKGGQNSNAEVIKMNKEMMSKMNEMDKAFGELPMPSLITKRDYASLFNRGPEQDFTDFQKDFN
eukprot:CAMPEP_0168620504 /NCGR_PEP_ID=MMETSP0449_2-20121227/7173_1 /TAXON_ID=1082188 /ORGANISM="Strombidium rassoulzadegani, Strain ras09" /LENGTH=173 /DNA_ID=CAMNT_0008661515 /DNA_START=232 /DNA_END=753 /DNA_ORIENTATION=+